MQQTCDEVIPCTGRGLAFPRDCGLSAYTWITCRVHAACAHQQIPVFLSFFFFPLMQQDNPSNIKYLFVTGLSCWSCTRWPKQIWLREEHVHAISKGLELQIFAS